MLKKVVAIALFLIVGCLTAHAQSDDSNANNGSVYSRIGVGIPLDGGSSGAEGMGLWGVSFVEPFVPGYANPAHWGNAIYGMATGGISLQNISASDNTGSSVNTLLAPDYFQLQFPIIRNELGVSVSLRPVTRSAYSQVQIGSRIIGAPSARDTLFYQSTSQGGGGINALEMGSGWRINRNISVGYAASLMFASIDQEHSTIFASSEYAPVRFTRQTSGIGFGNRFGLQLNFPSVLARNDQINIGAAVTLPVTLDAERVEEAEKRLANGSSQTVVTREGGNLGKGKVGLPASVNAGVTYQANPLFAVSTEGLYQNWSDFRYDFDSAEEQMAEDRYKIGLGLRYFPYISGSDKFLSGFKYRLGASYDTGHLNINGGRVETLMFSLGLGILSPGSRSVNTRSSVDIALEYGIRGTKDKNLVKEHIWGLRLSLNLAELMFYRPKLQ